MPIRSPAQVERRRVLRAAALLVAWFGLAFVLPAAHEWSERHRDAGLEMDAARFDVPCPEHCDDPAHGHAGHDHATCPTCKALHAPAATPERIAAALPASPGADSRAGASRTAHSVAAAPSRPRGPPSSAS